MMKQLFSRLAVEIDSKLIILRSLVFLVLLFPATAFSATSCLIGGDTDLDGAPFCIYYTGLWGDQDICPVDSGYTTVSSCSTSNLLGTCSHSFDGTLGSVWSWYDVWGEDISFDIVINLSDSCTSTDGIWSGGIPPFPVETQVSGSLSNLTVTTRIYFNSIGFTEQAMALPQSRAFSQRSSSSLYKVFVAAFAGDGLPIPAGFYFLNSNANWSHYTGGAIPEYLSNIDSTQTSYIDIAILEGVDVSNLIGTQIYVGYGTDDQEMVSAGRYRSIYTVQE